MIGCELSTSGAEDGRAGGRVCADAIDTDAHTTVAAAMRTEPGLEVFITLSLAQSVQSERDDHVAGWNRHELLPFSEVTDRRAVYRTVAGKRPQPLAGGRVEREDYAFERSAEHQVTGGAHHPAPWRRQHAVLPLDG